MSKFILAFTKKSSNISKPYFDTLYSWGFEGVGADGSFDLSLLNGVEWKRVTNTSVSEAENDGFINEVWKTTIRKPVLRDLVLSAENKNSEYPDWIVSINGDFVNTVILRTGAGNITNRVKPWEVPITTQWWGEMMLPVNGNFSLSNSVFIPNGDKTRYIKISGCPTESMNGTYYQMDPITINDKTYNLCFTNGIYLLETPYLHEMSAKYLYELNNSLLIQKFYSFENIWYNSETSEYIDEISSDCIGDWQHGYDAQ